MEECMNSKNTDMKTYRCGNCGTPTDKDGHTLSVGDCNELTEQQLNDAELVYGYCCIEELNRDNYIIVTRDMASDAGDASLEGERWRW